MDARRLAAMAQGVHLSASSLAMNNFDVAKVAECQLLAQSGPGLSMSALPHFSDVDLLGYGKRFVHLDP